MSSFRRDSGMEYRQGRDQHERDDRNGGSHYPPNLYGRGYNRRNNKGYRPDSRRSFQRSYEISPIRTSQNSTNDQEDSRAINGHQRPTSHQEYRSSNSSGQRYEMSTSSSAYGTHQDNRESRGLNSNPPSHKNNQEVRPSSSSRRHKGNGRRTNEEDRNKAAALNASQPQIKNVVPDDEVAVVAPPAPGNAVNELMRGFFGDAYVEEEDNEPPAEKETQPDKEEKLLKLHEVEKRTRPSYEYSRTWQQANRLCGDTSIPNPFPWLISGPRAIRRNKEVEKGTEEKNNEEADNQAEKEENNRISAEENVMNGIGAADQCAPTESDKIAQIERTQPETTAGAGDHHSGGKEPIGAGDGEPVAGAGDDCSGEEKSVIERGANLDREKEPVAESEAHLRGDEAPIAESEAHLGGDEAPVAESKAHLRRDEEPVVGGGAHLRKDEEPVSGGGVHLREDNGQQQEDGQQQESDAGHNVEEISAQPSVVEKEASNEELKIRLQKARNAVLEAKIASTEAQAAMEERIQESIKKRLMGEAALEEAKANAAAKDLEWFNEERKIVERNHQLRLEKLRIEGSLDEEKKKKAEEELGTLSAVASRSRGRARALRPPTASAASTVAPQIMAPAQVAQVPVAPQPVVRAQASVPPMRSTRNARPIPNYAPAKRRKITKD